jgi:hypothetical protein
MHFETTIWRLLLCVAFVLASSYAQALAHVDDHLISSEIHASKAELPPCHEAMHDQESGKTGGHHDGCCTNFSCAVGLTVEYVPTYLPRASLRHEIDYGDTSASGAWQPLSPPPKSI